MTNPIQGLPVIVDVTAHPPGSSEPYTIDWRFQGQPSQGNTDIILPPGSGSHDMTFNLIDNSGKGLRFKAQANDAMWTRSGNTCPTAPGNGNNQMSNGAVSADRMQLTINDDNSGNARRLKYALRFDPDHPTNDNNVHWRRDSRSRGDIPGHRGNDDECTAWGRNRRSDRLPLGPGFQQHSRTLVRRGALGASPAEP